ncbi:MAG: nuclear transport factor 2 family protein [Pseudomonadota bacterium]
MRRTILNSLLLGLISLSGSYAMADAADSVEARNKAAIVSSFDAWGGGTGGPFELLADDATWTIVGRSVVSKTYPSREAFMSEVIRPFNARMRGGLKPAIRNIYADGNTVIVFFDARGTALDGKPYENTYSWFLKMDDGRITEAFAFFDSIEFNDYWRRVAPKKS